MNTYKNKKLRLSEDNLDFLRGLAEHNNTSVSIMADILLSHLKEQCEVRK